MKKERTSTFTVILLTVLIAFTALMVSLLVYLCFSMIMGGDFGHGNGKYDRGPSKYFGGNVSGNEVKKEVLEDGTVLLNGMDTRGSSGAAEGRVVLVSLFYDGKEDWGDDMRAEAGSNTDVATQFIESSAAEYGKNIEFVYDTSAGSDLNYDMDLDDVYIPSNIQDVQGWGDLVEAVDKFITKKVDSDALRDEYGATGIVYAVFLNDEGTCCAFPYYAGVTRNSFNEMCFLYYNARDGKVGPSVYAHEMLHLFGARDLYKESVEDGTTTDLVRYTMLNFPDELMLYAEDSYGSGISQGFVSNSISEITAYFVGWLDDIPELEKFPGMKSEYPASFTVQDDGT